MLKNCQHSIACCIDLLSVEPGQLFANQFKEACSEFNTSPISKLGHVFSRSDDVVEKNCDTDPLRLSSVASLLQISSLLPLPLICARPDVTFTAWDIVYTAAVATAVGRNPFDGRSCPAGTHFGPLGLCAVDPRLSRADPAI